MVLNKASILIKKAALEFDKVANPIFARYDLSASQYKVLKFLYTRETKTARVVDLERQYSMTHPTALGLVNQLEKKGYATRVDNPNDARGKLIALTQKADSMKEELYALGEEVDRKLTRNLTKEEKEELIALLKKLMDLTD